jgi:hypothetical protein
MSNNVAEIMNASYGLQRQYPSRAAMQEFVFDNVDVLIYDESIDILRFIMEAQGTDGILYDVSDGVALNVNKLDMFVLQGVYDMIVKFKEAAGSVESIVFD